MAIMLLLRRAAVEEMPRAAFICQMPLGSMYANRLIATGSQASADDIAGIVSAYMAAIGVCNLGWGPLSDVVGRRRPLLFALVVFAGTTIGYDAAYRY